MDKLAEGELNQLKMLLIRYLAYHAQGVFNIAIDALLARYRSGVSMIVSRAATLGASLIGLSARAPPRMARRLVHALIRLVVNIFPELCSRRT
jgi:hypothetical protein